MNLLYRLHLCTWGPVAEGVGVTEPRAGLPGQGRTHREACSGRDARPAAFFSSGTACRFVLPLSAGFSIVFFERGEKGFSRRGNPILHSGLIYIRVLVFTIKVTKNGP